MDTILTCYLTGRDDPQHFTDPRPQRWTPDQAEVVRIWIHSLEHCGLHGIIFHDELSPAFIHRWASENVVFERIVWRTPWTAAEERVSIYADWLSNRPAHSPYQLHKVLMTDISDVEFYRDPFEQIVDEDLIYIGSETERIGQTELVKGWLRDNYNETRFWDLPILNPGIVGGYRETALNFLNRWLDEMAQAIKPVHSPHDLAAFNRLIYGQDILFATGYPLHTEFRKHEPDDGTVAIRHK